MLSELVKHRRLNELISHAYGVFCENMLLRREDSSEPKQTVDRDFRDFKRKTTQEFRDIVEASYPFFEKLLQDAGQWAAELRSRAALIGGSAHEDDRRYGDEVLSERMQSVLGFLYGARNIDWEEHPPAFAGTTEEEFNEAIKTFLILGSLFAAYFPQRPYRSEADLEIIFRVISDNLLATVEWERAVDKIYSSDCPKFSECRGLEDAALRTKCFITVLRIGYRNFVPETSWQHLVSLLLRGQHL